MRNISLDFDNRTAIATCMICRYHALGHFPGNPITRGVDNQELAHHALGAFAIAALRKAKTPLIEWPALLLNAGVPRRLGFSNLTITRPEEDLFCYLRWKADTIWQIGRACIWSTNQMKLIAYGGILATAVDAKQKPMKLHYFPETA